jgi:mono/diheme cytochrome c family protein
MKRLRNRIVVLLALLLLGIGTVAFIYSGFYNIAADDPHSRLVYSAVETLRDRSIAVRARPIAVPSLDDSDLLLSGGPDYAEMCAGCHLQPGVSTSEFRDALYPQPPNLSQPSAKTPAEKFWVIKHGIKMSAMPAWGATHTDERIWAMVAFLQRLPELTPAQYQILTARTPGDMAAHRHGANAHD